MTVTCNIYIPKCNLCVFAHRLHFSLIKYAHQGKQKEINIMKKKVLKIVVAVIIVLTVLGLIASGVIGKMVADGIMYQNDGTDTKGASVRQLKEGWGYDLDGFYSEYTGIEVSAVAEDGNVVPGTYFNADGDNGEIVILVHGAGGDRVSVYPLAEQYLMRGYNVISIDQRGCGDNQDRKVTFGIHESLDVAAMVAYAREELGADKVIVHGQSMGGQTVAIYASNVVPGEANAADAVICDSPVPDMEYMIRSVFAESDNEEDFYTSSVNYMIFVGKIATKLIYHVDFADGDTVAAVANDMLPTMVVVSEKDETCLPEKVQEVYNNVGTDEKTIMSVDSAHIEGVIDDPEGYMDGVMDFLGSYGL
jgi:pimeloyl-ACP methyl ester carboxylesterase